MQWIAIAKNRTAVTPKKTIDAGVAAGIGGADARTNSSCTRIRAKIGSGNATEIERKRLACTRKYGRMASRASATKKPSTRHAARWISLRTAAGAGPIAAETMRDWMKRSAASEMT